MPQYQRASHRRAALAILSLACVCQGGPREAAASSKSSPPATVRFRDAGTDLITSDGSGSYSSGVDGVQAFFQSGGNLTFNLLGSNLRSPAMRRLRLDFGTSLDGSANPFGGPIPAAVYLSNTVLNFDGTVASGGLLGMKPGQTSPTQLAIQFPDPDPGNTTWWYVRFQRQYYPATTVTVRCLAATAWDIEAGSADVALLQSTPTLQSSQFANHGYFHLPCQFTVTEQ